VRRVRQFPGLQEAIRVRQHSLPLATDAQSTGRRGTIFRDALRELIENAQPDFERM
jgi:hypothetical protein